MQIIFKQTDIINALKLYVTSQGIALAGKSVDVSFTAGRGQTGISAELTIEDAPTQVGLATAVIMEAKAPAASMTDPQTSQAETPEAPEPEATPLASEPEAPSTASSSSLFG